ncbi:hypothetical protein [Arthrobacter sp. RIT-PI-e]|uniref:hypothetical protein n=1 Tax=Arthrobacter sp. RIT-PI-e TaxID=1681197 RepID=UPI00128E9F10|nr:hypothetical protein [Arthrobacter sp. RIT-PI-e]
MENIDAVLRAADRAAAAPYTYRYDTPAWYPFAMAAYFTAIAGTFPLLMTGRLVLGMGLLVLAVGAFLALTMVLRRRFGTWPSMDGAPVEIRRVFGVLLLLALAVVLVSTIVWQLTGAPGGLLAIFLTSLAVVWSYEFRLYPAAAARLRRRLA